MWFRDLMDDVNDENAGIRWDWANWPTLNEQGWFSNLASWFDYPEDSFSYKKV